MPIYSMEGNIGVGKTTFINMVKQLHKTREIIVLEEPVAEWLSIKNNENKTILELFYADQNKYAFSFQMMAYISRIALLKQTIREHPQAIIITERSVYTDKHVFAKMLFDEGKIEKVNYEIYNKWFEHFIEDVPISKIIYLRCTPAIAHSRVIKRNRPGETITLDYLTKCHTYHEEWIEQSNVPCMILDANKENTNTNVDNWNKELSTFLNI
uniref:Deoxynucleoside kinase n=1 Tax=Megaviridae environmental sample TaxID=1737588 RepID=A0A5J6VL32_9VIRU|nr:MAG: deoxynucleoside kinase [Megaviridae environmental sample]